MSNQRNLGGATGTANGSPTYNGHHNVNGYPGSNGHPSSNGHHAPDPVEVLPQTVTASDLVVNDRDAKIAGRLASGEAMLSVVIPLLNEEDNLDELYRRLKLALAGCAPNHEIIFVDDGSRDGSYGKLMGFWHNDQKVTVLRFRRNFGKAAALSAGFDRVRGDVVVMMDADLQD